ncbi:MAG: Rossmann-like and DUF2520 domain-containing protein [Actinomycetota bacterium]
MDRNGGQETVSTPAPTPASGEIPTAPPQGPFNVAVLGAGRVGGSFARALRAAGHTVLAEIHRDDDPSAIARADVIVIAVPDDALEGAAAAAARLGQAGAVVVHTCGIQGLAPLRDCGPLVAAIHPAAPVASPEQPLDGVIFGVTCPDAMRDWCTAFVRDLGGTPLFVAESDRVRYHAALSVASNFAVTLAGDAADLLGGYETLIPLLRATVENVARLGPDDALTGPIVRGDAGTVAAHLRALPADLLEPYVANARRTLERAVASGRLSAGDAARVRDALEEALVR